MGYDQKFWPFLLPPTPKGVFWNQRTDFDEIWYVSSLGVNEWVTTKTFDHSPFPTPQKEFLEPVDRFRWNLVCIILGCLRMSYDQNFWTFPQPPPLSPPKGVFRTSRPISMKFGMYHPWVYMNGLQPKMLTISPPSFPPPKGAFGMQ